MAGVTVKITGLDEVDRLLKTLPVKVQKKIVRSSTRKSLKPVLAEAKQNAMMMGGEMGGKIAKSLKIKAPKRQKPGRYLLMVRLTEDPDFVHTNKDGTRHYIPADIEFGHGSNKEGVAYPFMRRAADDTQSAAVKVFKDEIAKGIEKAVLTAK